VVVYIKNAVFKSIHVIFCMTIPLMGVKIDDHKTFVAIPYLHVMSNESYIRVDAKTTSSVRMRMMKASTKVNRPSFMVGDTCSLN
jgi:hypothetical protein